MNEFIIAGRNSHRNSISNDNAWKFFAAEKF